MRTITLLFLFLSLTRVIYAQVTELRSLDHGDFLIWNTLQDIQLSADANFISYRVVPGEGDPRLRIYNTADKTTREIERVRQSNIDYNGKFIFGIITPHRDSLRNLERKKVEKNKWPSDTLFITGGQSSAVLHVPNVTQYKSPEKFGDWIAYTIKDEPMSTDTSKEKRNPKKISYILSSASFPQAGKIP